MWLIGCIIVGLYTGNLLFDTYEDHEHFSMVVKNSGLIPEWMVKSCMNDLRKVLHSNGEIKATSLENT